MNELKKIKKLIPAKPELFLQNTVDGVAWIVQNDDIIIEFGSFDSDSEYFQTEKVLSGAQIKKLELDKLSISDSILSSGKVKLKLKLSGGCTTTPHLENFERVACNQLPEDIIDFNSFVSKDKYRPQLRYVCISSNGLVASTDATQMLYREHSANIENDYMASTEIIKAISLLDNCILDLTENVSCVSSGKIKVYTRNCKGRYPAASSIIPTNPPKIFKGNINLKNADLIVDRDELIVFKNKSIYTNNGSLEALSSEWGADFPIGANRKQLASCLKITGDFVSIQCSGIGKPLVINKEILLMPMKAEGALTEIWNNVN